MKIYFGAVAVVVVLAARAARGWRWPEGAESVRIDTKVRFVDAPADKGNQGNGNGNVQADEVPFRQPTNTAGFYNRPPGEGRFPVRAERYRRPAAGYPVNFGSGHMFAGQESDGTLDSLQYCKCVSTPNCNPAPDTQHACGANEYLCCYRPPAANQNSEVFNEVEDERPALLPSYTNIEGPFPAPPGGSNRRPTDGRRQTQIGVLVGPGGPTGNIGVPNNQVLVSPGGPTGAIGPGNRPDVLVGPDGPTGVIGPASGNRNQGPFDIGQSESAQRGVLVGPGGPTGVIGPQYNRPVLVGPGGPTGVIGPRQGFYGSQRRGVLVGPGGPTGIVGPRGFNQRQNPGVLVGPGGPTGIIGPGRSILVGPGGPTGQVGPRESFFGK